MTTSLIDLFNPPRIASPTGGRIFISGKPATLRDLESVNIERDIKQARAEVQRNYCERHPDRVSARKKAYRDRNKEQIRGYQKNYRESQKLKGGTNGNA